MVVKEGGGQIERETVRQISSFVTSCKISNMQGRGAVRKILFNKKSSNILSSVVGRGGAPLAGITANGKRKFDSKVGGGCKKRKGGGD